MEFEKMRELDGKLAHVDLPFACARRPILSASPFMSSKRPAIPSFSSGKRDVSMATNAAGVLLLHTDVVIGVDCAEKSRVWCKLNIGDFGESPDQIGHASALTDSC